MRDHVSPDEFGPAQKLKRFLRDDTGAVTVDWVVLTASIALFGAAIGFTVSSNVPGLADEVAAVMSTQTIGAD